LTSRIAGEIQIREETNADLEDIHKVHQAAFDSPAEAHLVDLLRDRDKVSISLMAAVNGEIVGHILFSPVSLDPPPPEWHALGLAPVGVIPGRQRQGLGAALVNHGLERCQELGIDLVVVLGDPAYYSRFGFQRAIDYGLSNEYLADEHFMVLELTPGVLGNFAGLVKYAPEFNETDT
jgi:putative acetyltransferase